MKQETLIIGLLVLTFGAVMYGAVTGAGDQSPAPAAESAAADKELIEAIDGLRSEIRDMRKSLDRRVGALEVRSANSSQPRSAGAVSGDADEGGDAAMSGMAPGTAATGELAEELAKRVEERMTERIDRLANRERNGQGEWKAPIDELTEELELDEAQAERAQQVFDRGKDELYVLLKTMRLDGGSLLDDLADELTQGDDPQATFGRFVGRIFSDKVPGTDDTYLTHLLSTRQELERELGTHLRDEQMTEFRKLRVDFFDVKTGYDPIGDYIRAKSM